MRSCSSCFNYKRHEEGSLLVCYNTACWSGVNTLGLNKIDIFIYDFDEPTTNQYQDLLVRIINEITPCEIVTINNKIYIKFRTLEAYENSLVLLHFIRNLWYEPGTHTGYSLKFFRYLEEIDKECKKKDPLVKLTEANKKACDKIKWVYSTPGHSPITNVKCSRTMKELLNKPISSAIEFIRGEY